MKKLYICALSLMAVSWTTAIAFLFVLPGQIPMHLNPYVDGGIGRFGSKFECLIFSAAATIVGALFLLAARNRGKKDDIAEEKAFVLSSLPRYGDFLFYGTFLHARRLGAINNMVSNLYFSVDSTTRIFFPATSHTRPIHTKAKKKLCIDIYARNNYAKALNRLNRLRDFNIISSHWLFSHSLPITQY